MSIHIWLQTEACLIDEARRQGISVDALVERMLRESAASFLADATAAPELPILHLGPIGALHRRDIYSDDR